MNKPRELLKKIPLFAPLGEKDLKVLSESVRLQKVKQGQAIFRKGDEGTALYVLKTGRIKIVLPSSLGDEIIVSIFSEGDFFGEMSLLDGEPRSADAIAIEPCELFILSRNDFLAFLQANLSGVKSILALLSQRLRRTDDFLEDVCFLNISDRLTKALLELAKAHGKKDGGKTSIDLTLTQKELGDLVGATRESVNKELKYLREEGLIATEGNKITIINMKKLSSRIEE